MQRLAAVSILVALLSTPAAPAGTVITSGALPLFSQAAQYTAWDLVNDVDLSGAFNGSVSGMALHNGRLFMSTTNPLRGQIGSRVIEGGLLAATPGPAGLLAVVTKLSTGLSASDPRASLKPSRIAINTSGAGFGAFSGPDPILVTLASTGVTIDPLQGTLSVAASAVAPGAFSTIIAPSPLGGPQDLAYARSIDRFLLAEASIGASTSNIEVRPHSAASLLAPERTITLSQFNVAGLTLVSGAFASRLTGVAVADSEAILAVSDTENQFVAPMIGLHRLDGSLIAPVQSLPALGVVGLRSIVADEANDLLYFGGRLGSPGTGVIVISVPAPSSMLVPAGMLLLSRRRRPVSTR